MVNGAPRYSPVSQMSSVFDSSAQVIFNYIDYNALMGHGSECKPLVADGTLSIIKEANEEAAECRSAEDPSICYDDVAFRIGRRYRAQRTQVIICAHIAGISITNDGVAAIQDCLTENTISVVMSVFKKRSEASIETTSAEEDIDDVDESNSDIDLEYSLQEVDTEPEDIKSKDTESEYYKSEDFEPGNTTSQENDADAEPKSPESDENESGDVEPEAVKLEMSNE